MEGRFGYLVARPVIISLALLWVHGAHAQAPVIEGEQPAAPSLLVSDPAIIGRCLCMGRHLSKEKGLLERLDRQFRAAKAHDQATEAAVARARPFLKPDDGEQVAAYRRLLEESQRADRDLYSRVQPAYAAQVARYNQTFNVYNDGCTRMQVVQTLQSKVAQTLVCLDP